MQVNCWAGWQHPLTLRHYIGNMTVVNKSPFYWKLIDNKRQKTQIVIAMTIHARDTKALRSTPGIVLYRQFADLIRKQIDSGSLVPGERLPSIQKLASTFDVSVVTVRLALAVLEDDGLIKRHQGRGTFVATTIQEKRWIKLEFDWNALIRTWDKSKPRPIKILDTVGVPTLAPEDGAMAPSYRYMRRVHQADGVNYAVVDIYVDRRVYALSPRRFDGEMVIVVLQFATTG